MIDFESQNGRKEFIHNTESGLYEGTNIDGEKVLIMLERKVGMDVKTQKKNKPKWLEVVEYDSDGFQLSVSYEPAI